MMAQFYHVLSQDDKTVDNTTNFYPAADENQTVQYVNVIAAEPPQPQQFQAQPVVVSSEQLMVVEGQGQPVIIDQSQVSYQQPSFIIQESPHADFQNNQQQVFYMANPPSNQQPIVIEQSVAQPVVLNHQLMQSQVSKVATEQQGCGQISNSVIQEKVPNQMQQVKEQLNQQRNVVGGRIVHMSQQQRTVASQNVAQGGMQCFQAKKLSLNEDDDDELVTLADGTRVTMAHYKKILATQKQNRALHEKLGISSSTTNAQRGRGGRGGRQPPSPRARNAKPRQPRNRSFDGQHFITEQQYQQVIQQRQQLNRPSQSQPQSQQPQQQYLIQPPRVHEKPPIPRPLPAFLQTRQIQTIIENTPVNEEYSDSIRMLVLLDNGEQRLITFTLPKEACTIQEILEQVNVPFTPETPIQVNEANTNGLNYIVTVGLVPGCNMDLSVEDVSGADPQALYIHQVVQEAESPVEALQSPTTPSPEPPKDLPPKFIEGKLAVCSMCGYLSEDFNKCTRCRRKLPDNVRAVLNTNNGKKIDPRSLTNDKRLTICKANGVPKMNLLQKKPAKKTSKLLECETVVVSSDDEETGEKKPHVKNVNEQLLEKLGAQVTLSPISKEPSILDIQKHSIVAATRTASDRVPGDKIISTIMHCRTVRIGSYRYVPPETVRIDSNGLTLRVPHPKQNNTIKVIRVESSDMVKVLISFQKSLPVIFYYLVPRVGMMIRTALDMAQGLDYYFDPLSDCEESHRRITLLPETMTEENKSILQKIYSRTFNLMEELNYKEANDILIKTCPKELTKSVLSYGNLSEIKQILTYPPEGRGRISINTEDYMCLGQDQFLNDVIIDFYLKYLVLNLPKEKQDKVHVFSTFFYKRLTTKPTKASRKSQPTELDPNLSAAERRHSRVKNWTKNVNIFEKDFVIVPINENCHWFLAIICYPNMNGCYTMDGQSIKIEPRQPRKKKVITAFVGNLTVTVKEKKVEQTIMCEDPELSDKDEAEGDDSELDSDDSEEPSTTEDTTTLSVENNSDRPPIRQPCILIFDSLAGASRTKIVATLRDYLTCEYKAKMNGEKVFTKDVIKGACPKVPQQTNFTDCGLYLLQYVEQFFNDPIKDYYIPISHLKTWFEELTVTKKREDISILIKTLMKQYGKDLDLLPDVIFPTLDGELTERALMEKEDNFMDPDEMDEPVEEEEGEEYLPPNQNKKAEISDKSENSDNSVNNSPIKPSSESVKNKKTFAELPVVRMGILKPDVSELPKQISNKDTLNYLKTKRILRHNKSANPTSSEEPDEKKVKTMDTVDSP